MLLLLLLLLLMMVMMTRMKKKKYISPITMEGHFFVEAMSKKLCHLVAN